jgi:DNA (cytosine-5)-methyltransferase 1
MLTMTDLFCGGGGSSSGAKMVRGVRVDMAANHWRLAVTTHNTNHPEADHDCADLSQVNPRKYRKTDILWASPECTNHTQAKTHKGMTQEEIDAEERSRATMWDVVRFTEHHRYKAVIVENVVEAAKWLPFMAWLMAMRALGYEHQIVFLNSAHASAAGDPAAQSRDRIYIVFTRVGDRKPDVERWTSPHGQCTACGHAGQLVRRWKARSNAWPLDQWGKYKQQYDWTCAKCATITEPFIKPALTIIDWAVPLQRIGDKPRKEFFADKARTKSLGFHPLAPKTLRRIEAGLRKHRGEFLAVPVEGRDGLQARPMSQLLRTQTGRAETGFCVPFITELRGGGSKTRGVDRPLATVTASGNHHMLTVPPELAGGFIMRNNGSKGAGGEHCTSLLDVVRTMTTKGHQSLVSCTEANPRVEDCGFRMLEPHEVMAAMAFEPEYILLGSRRDRVRMAGNAVTPPAATCLVAAVVEALEGSVSLGHLDLAA